MGVLGGGIMGEGWRGGIRTTICRGGIIRRGIGGWGRIWRLGRRRWGGGAGRLRGRLGGRLGERGVRLADFALDIDDVFLFLFWEDREVERGWVGTTTTIWMKRMMDIYPLALMRRAKSGTFSFSRLVRSVIEYIHIFFVLFGERDGRLSTMCYYLLVCIWRSGVVDRGVAAQGRRARDEAVVCV